MHEKNYVEHYARCALSVAETERRLVDAAVYVLADIVERTA
jgi:hypothetical protein